MQVASSNGATELNPLRLSVFAQFFWSYHCVLPVPDFEDAETSVVSFLEATYKDFRLKI